MNTIRVRPDKETFFKDILKNAFRTVIRPGKAASIVRHIGGQNGHALAGVGHEVYALYLLDCLEGIPTEISGDLQETLVLRALIECKNGSNATETGFIASLSDLCTNYLREPKQTFSCMFFLQLTNLPEWILGRRYLGHKLRLASKTAWNGVRDRVDFICSQSRIDRAALEQLQAVELSIRAKRPEEAISAADEVSNLLRGSFHAARRPFPLFGRDPGPSNAFRPSPLYFVRSGTEHVCYAFVPETEIQPISLPERLTAVMQLYLQRLRHVPKEGSSRDILRRAIGLFAVSGDCHLVQHEFLALWQTLEMLSLESETGKTAVIAAKIGNYFSHGSSTITPQLIALARFRNEFVHRGWYDNERTSVSYALCEIARKVLMQYAQLSDELPTQDGLRQLQSLMTTGPRVLPSKGRPAKVVRHVRRLRPIASTDHEG